MSYKVEGPVSVSIARAVGITLLSLSVVRPTGPAVEHIVPGGVADVFPGTYVPQMRTATVILRSSGYAPGQNVAIGIASHAAASAGASIGSNNADGRAPVQGVGYSLGKNTVLGVGWQPSSGASAGQNIALGIGRGRHDSIGSSIGTNTTTGIGQSGIWPAHVVLRPTITDDGWGGVLTYAWTQVSGPATATIISPAAAITEITFLEVEGTYVFQLAVSRASDAFIGYILVRVRVYTTASQVSPALSAPAVVMTVNGVPQAAIVNSFRITPSVGQPSTALCTMRNADYSQVMIEPGNEVILTRDGVRLMGGICLSVGLTEEEPGILFYHPSLVGFAWHLGRATITKEYKDQSISAIAADILTHMPGGITGDYIAPGLPIISITFKDVYGDAALTELVKMVPGGAHWKVDDDKKLHFAVLETANDPTAITRNHPSYRNLSVTKTLSKSANRLKVYYTEPASATSTGTSSDSSEVRGSVIGDVVVGQTEIQVSSLNGYRGPHGLYPDAGQPTSSDYGEFTANGLHVVYRGIAYRRNRSVYEEVSFGYMLADAIQESGSDLGYALYLSQGGAYINDPPIAGSQGNRISGYPFGDYWLALQTPDGETPLMAYFNGTFWQAGWYNTDSHGLPLFFGALNLDYPVIWVDQNAVKISVLGIQFQAAQYPWSSALDPRSPAWSRITSINVYKRSNEPSAPGDSAGQIFLIGSVPPRGGTLIDKISKANLAPIVEPVTSWAYREDGSCPWDPPSTCWLTQCTVEAIPASIAGTLDDGTFVIVEDLVAQRALAAKLGGGDSGIIELAIQAGAIGRQAATDLGNAYLAAVQPTTTDLSCSVQDDLARPGQVMDMNLPAPFGAASLKVQQATVVGFEPNIPHRTEVTAATRLVTLEDLLKVGANAASAAAISGAITAAGAAAVGISGGSGGPGPQGPAGPAASYDDLGGMDGLARNTTAWMAVPGSQPKSYLAAGLLGVTVDAVLYCRTDDPTTSVQLRIQNLTDSTTLVTGTASASTDPVEEVLSVTLVAGKRYELQVKGSDTSDGVFGWGSFRVRPV